MHGSLTQGVINIRTWRKICLNPFLRVFGWQISSMWIEFSDLKDEQSFDEVRWDNVFCRCPVQLNLFKNLRESWIYDLGDNILYRWENNPTALVSLSKAQGFVKTLASDVD